MNHHDSNVCLLLFPGVVITLNSKPIKFGSSFRSETSPEPLGLLFTSLINPVAFLLSRALNFSFVLTHFRAPCLHAV